MKYFVFVAKISRKFENLYFYFQDKTSIQNTLYYLFNFSLTMDYNFKKLCLTLREDDDFLQQMKEKFYQIKINEAKEYKKQNVKGNYMDLLPDDVQQHIMNFKKKAEEEEQKQDTYKPGDIVFYTSSYGDRRKTTTGFYVINSATKTQYRVSKITHSHRRIDNQRYMDCEYIYTIPRDKSQWEFYEDKSPNITKKAYLEPIKNLDDDHRYIRCEEDKTKWVYIRTMYFD